MRWHVLTSLLITAIASGCAGTEQDEAARTTARRGPIEVVYEASRHTAPAGTPLTVSIIATAAAGASVETPLVGTSDAEAWGAFEVLDAPPAVDVPLGDGRHRWTQTLRVDSFQPGEHPLPPLDIQFVDRRAATELRGTVSVEPLTLTITSNLSAEHATMHDVVGWRDLPSGPWWPWMLAGGAVVAVILAGGLWVLSRIRATGPPPTPAEIALAAIDTLTRRNLLQSGEVETFYVVLSDIIRRYIEGRLGLAAPRKTTAEFLSDAEGDHRLLESQRDLLRAFLRTADLVKFAGHEPALEYGRQAADDARMFVQDCERRLATEAGDRQMEVAPC
ncbi:MAG: hypothetical protein QF733_06285 [Phycisphaerales bacterium]|jgi:hypothetical protein|nr:hypothetical protein [Phycisphaerales bacterium]